VECLGGPKKILYLTMSTDRIISKQIHINAAAKVVFNAMISPSLIKQWWYAQTAIVVPEKDGIYALTWGEKLDSPDYITVSRLSEFEFGKKLCMTNELYYSPHGSLPFDAQLHVTFDFAQKDEGTELRVLQEGIPKDKEADEFYEGTVKGWETTLQSLKNVVEDEVASTGSLLEPD